MNVQKWFAVASASLAGTLVAETAVPFAKRGVRQFGLQIGQPVVENPYAGGDYTRDVPKRLRFLRLPITSTIGTIRQARASMAIQGTNTPTGEQDCAGILHWERQPRQEAQHLSELHEQLETGDDVAEHMLTHHFSKNRPVDIPQGRTEKVDLLLRVEDREQLLTTNHRQNGLRPGSYHLAVTIRANNILTPVRVMLDVEIGEDFSVLNVTSFQP